MTRTPSSSPKATLAFGAPATTADSPPELDGVATVVTGPRPKTTGIRGGTMVGEYRVEAQIGEGGMGVVYRAVHPIIGKTVAIKVLSAALAREDNSIKRFVQEARAVNAIRHPNLVDIFSFGQLADGRYYYVMEFLEGKSLGRLLRDRGRLDAEDAYPIFRDIGRALEAAHGKGIIHRDLKPDNVYLVAGPGAGGGHEHEGEPFRAKLFDFGLAKLVGGTRDAEGPKTQAGMAVGTPAYMAPEQCLGRPDVDARADIYALGVMFFEALCGRVPFRGKTTVEVWQQHVRAKPPTPSSLAPSSVSPGLDHLILRMLEKSPSMRFQDATEFLAALETLHRGQGMALPKLSPLVHHARLEGTPPPSLLASPSPGVLSPLGSFSGGGRALVPASGNESDIILLDGGSTPSRLPPPEPVLTPRPADEVDELRTSLRLTIHEPAFESHDPAQASVLSIDLAAALPPAEAPPPVVFPIRPIRERAGGQELVAAPPVNTLRPIEARGPTGPAASGSAGRGGRTVPIATAIVVIVLGAAVAISKHKGWF